MATSKPYKGLSEVKASLNWQEKRSEVREKSTKGKYLRSSLQCLSNDDVLLSLASILLRSKVKGLDTEELYSQRSESSSRTSHQ